MADLVCSSDLAQGTYPSRQTPRQTQSNKMHSSFTERLRSSHWRDSTTLRVGCGVPQSRPDWMQPGDDGPIEKGRLFLLQKRSGTGVVDITATQKWPELSHHRPRTAALSGTSLITITISRFPMIFFLLCARQPSNPSRAARHHHLVGETHLSTMLRQM